jgi:hypothetical protein
MPEIFRFCPEDRAQNLASSHDYNIVVIIGVVNMADFKQQTFQRIGTAKSWLEKAEEAYEEEKDIRAELDLMLAEAELKRIREGKRAGAGTHWFWAMRHGSAFVLAAMLVFAGWGAVYWYAHPEVAPLAVPQSESRKSDANGGQPLSKRLQVKGVAVSGNPVAPAAVTAAPEKPKAAEPAADNQSRNVDVPNPQRQSAVVQTVRAKVSGAGAPQPVLSAEEMQKLVQAAGKSLRGQ